MKVYIVLLFIFFYLYFSFRKFLLLTLPLLLSQEVFLYVVRGWSVMISSSLTTIYVFDLINCFFQVGHSVAYLFPISVWFTSDGEICYYVSINGVYSGQNSLLMPHPPKIAKSYFCPVFVAFSQRNNWRSWWVLGLNRCDVFEHI